MEFITQIKTPAVIDGNFAEVKLGLETMMTAYSEIVVTEDNIPDCKKDVATLRKIKAAIDSKRKEVKREHEKPLKEFEAKCKELTGIIDKEVNRINGALDGYEVNRIADKAQVIKTIYAENIGEFAEYLPLERIWQKNWNNKTCTEKEITADIQQMALKVRQETSVIKQTCGEFADDCLAVYKQSGNNLQAAMNRRSDLVTAKERAEQALKTAVKPVEEPVQVNIPVQPENPVKQELEWKFTVYSKEDANSLRAYLEMFGMKYKEN